MLEEVLQAITPQKRKSTTYMIGIDGYGASGKTTLAANVQAKMPEIHVVHMDDFDLATNGKLLGDPLTKPIGADTDWRRVEEEVLLPLSKDIPARYSRREWGTGKHIEWCNITPGGIVLIEGVFATRNELFSYYDLTVWLDCSREQRLLRGLQRDGEAARDKWLKDWIPMEDRYVSAHSPQTKAAIRINTTEI